MLVLKIEMWPQGRGGDRVYELGRLVIYNKGDSADPKRGNYVAQLMRRGTTDTVQKEAAVEPAHSKELFDLFEKVGGPVEILAHARHAYPVWTLVAKALRALKVPGA